MNFSNIVVQQKARVQILCRYPYLCQHKNKHFGTFDVFQHCVPAKGKREAAGEVDTKEGERAEEGPQACPSARYRRIQYKDIYKYRDKYKYKYIQKKYKKPVHEQVVVSRKAEQVPRREREMLNLQDQS